MILRHRWLKVLPEDQVHSQNWEFLNVVNFNQIDDIASLPMTQGTCWDWQWAPNRCWQSKLMPKSFTEKLSLICTIPTKTQPKFTTNSMPKVENLGGRPRSWQKVVGDVAEIHSFQETFCYASEKRWFFRACNFRWRIPGGAETWWWWLCTVKLHESWWCVFEFDDGLQWFFKEFAMLFDIFRWISSI